MESDTLTENLQPSATGAYEPRIYERNNTHNQIIWDPYT